MVANSTKTQGLRDTPIHGKRALIEWARQRFLCRGCGRTSYDQHETFDPDRRMTKRLVEYIGRTALRLTFTEVAAGVGVDKKTVRLVWSDWSEREIGRLGFATPSRRASPPSAISHPSIEDRTGAGVKAALPRPRRSTPPTSSATLSA